MPGQSPDDEPGPPYFGLPDPNVSQYSIEQGIAREVAFVRAAQRRGGWRKVVVYTWVYGLLALPLVGVLAWLISLIH